MANKRFKHKRPQRDNYQPPYSEEILSESVEVLSLREETLNLLVKANVTTLKEVLKREEKDFYRISTFNKKNLIDVKKALQARKLELKPTTEKPQVDDTESKDNKATANNVAANANNPNRKQPNARNPQNARNTSSSSRNAENSNRNSSKDKYGVVESPSFASIVPEKPPRVVVVPEKDIPDIYVKINKGGKWGFKDRTGKQTVAPIYDEVFNYKEDICCVEKDELFGFINREGEEIVPIVYTCATSFSEGYACVFKKDKCGYIDATNQIIIDLKYDAGTPVIEGGCRVKLDGKWGELHIDTPQEVRWIN